MLWGPRPHTGQEVFAESTVVGADTRGPRHQFVGSPRSLETLLPEAQQILISLAPPPTRHEWANLLGSSPHEQALLAHEQALPVLTVGLGHGRLKLLWGHRLGIRSKASKNIRQLLG